MTGWWTLTDFYGFEGDHTILFRYVGKNAFHITIYMEDVPEIYFNRYLDEVEGRKPLTIGPFHHFSIKLSPLGVNASSLVSLSLIFFKNTIAILYSFCLLNILMLLKGIPPAFSEYFRQGRFKTVMVHGLLKDVECKVLKGRFPYKTIKIGSGWKYNNIII